MLIDTGLGDLESAAADARAAEKAGYDGAFTGEVSSDPFLPLVLAADATERIDAGHVDRGGLRPLPHGARLHGP